MSLALVRETPPPILVSIANPTVYHKALHSGSDSNREFGMHIFPNFVLHQLATTEGVS